MVIANGTTSASQELSQISFMLHWVIAVINGSIVITDVSH